MNILDCVLLVFILIFTIRGFARGLINEVFGIGSLIFSLFAAYTFYMRLAAVFAASMNGTLAKILSLVVIFAIAFIMVKTVQMLLKIVFSGTILKSLDKTLGLVVGFLEGAALSVLILFVMAQLNPTVNSEALRGGSFISNFINGIPV